MKKLLARLSVVAALLLALPVQGQRAINFNRDWQLHYPQRARLHAGETKTVTLPRAWNEDEAYRVGIASLPDDTCRYTKYFDAPPRMGGQACLHRV